ncbi:heterokaryon incompatibility protein-domain-containing protein [Xylariomycetidae sp. FL2044]|nr:heterokaryon incompatibility protein-domain-containing protein [Xylariomycetidae sp. FL2044]
MLCTVCQEVFTQKAPVSATLNAIGASTSLLSFQRGHHRSLASFLESARQECYACSLLLEKVCEAYGFCEPPLVQRDAAEHITRVAVTTPIASDPLSGTSDESSLRPTISLDVLPHAFGDQRTTSVGIELEIRQRSKSSNDRTEETRNTESKEEQRDNQARRWYYECRASHLCGRHIARGNFRPRRLVAIIGGGNAAPLLEWKVVETAVDRGTQGQDYATLSHRWPQQGMVCLTSETVSSFMKSPNPQELLPRRWQDALRMARALGLRYIWIDSLCIVQDSPEDWATESLTMDSIYQNSAITLLLSNPPYEMLPLAGLPYAARFRRCFIPFNAARWVEDIPDIPSGFMGGANTSAEDSLVELVCPDLDLLVLNRSETSKRGWIYQERILGNRLLVMDAGQWYWQCDRVWASEERPEIALSSAWYLAGRAARGMFKDGAAEEAHLGKRSSLWQQTVENYSQTLLTFDKDRLIAIAGVAKQFSHDLLGEYYAGLWGNTILFDLTWQCRRSGFRSLNPSVKVASPYNAPSWSWASTNKSVYFGTRVLSQTDTEVSDLGGTKLDLVDIHKISTAPGRGDPFGQLVAGEIELSGWLLRQTCVFQASPISGSIPSSEELTFPLQARSSGDRYSDIPGNVSLFTSDLPYSDDVTASFDGDVPPPDEVYLLPLYWVSSWSQEEPDDLLVSVAGAEGPDADDQEDEDIMADGDDLSSRWIFLLGLLLTPVSGTAKDAGSMPRYRRVGALNEWVDESTAFGSAVTKALGVHWDTGGKQAKPGTERGKTRICIV